MANYLDYLYQRQGIQPGLLGNAYNMAAQMLQNGSANTQALMQANDRIKAQQAQDEAAASRGLQQAAQRQAEDEARKKQGLMTIASLAFGGGGGEAAATPKIAEGASAAEIEGALATAAEGAEAGAKALEAAKAADAVVPAASGPSLLPGVGEKGAGMSFTPTDEMAKAASSVDWFTKNKEWLIPLFGNMALR